MIKALICWSRKQNIWCTSLWVEDQLASVSELKCLKRKWRKDQILTIINGEAAMAAMSVTPTNRFAHAT